MPMPQANKPKQAKASKPTTQRLNDVQVALRQVYRDPSKWNTLCLPLLGTLLFAFAVALIVVGATENIEDIIIIGAIFVLGSLIFYFLLYYNVCRPMCKRNQVSYESHIDKTVMAKPVRNLDELPDYGSYSEDDDYLQAVNKPVPDSKQLYGSRDRVFLATPATTKDVNFMDEELGTPPPPRVKSALERMVSPPPRPVLPDHDRGPHSPLQSTLEERVKKLEEHDIDLV